MQVLQANSEGSEGPRVGLGSKQQQQQMARPGVEKQPRPRADVVIAASQPSSFTLPSSNNSSSTQHTHTSASASAPIAEPANLPSSTPSLSPTHHSHSQGHHCALNDTTSPSPSPSFTASLRRKFAEVKNTSKALRRSISGAGKPCNYVQSVRVGRGASKTKHRRTKSDSLGEGSKSGLSNVSREYNYLGQGRGAASSVSLTISPGISEGESRVEPMPNDYIH